MELLRQPLKGGAINTLVKRLILIVLCCDVFLILLLFAALRLRGKAFAFEITLHVTPNGVLLLCVVSLYKHITPACAGAPAGRPTGLKALCLGVVACPPIGGSPAFGFAFSHSGKFRNQKGIKTFQVQKAKKYLHKLEFQCLESEEP